MSAYTQSLIQNEFKEEKIQQAEDQEKMMAVNIALAALTMAVAPSFAAQQVAGQTAAAATAATAPAIASGANAPILGIVEGLSKVSPAALKATAPLANATSILPQALQGPVGQGILKTGIHSIGSAIGGTLLGIKDRQYNYLPNPMDEYANPLSGTNLTMGLNTATSYYDSAEELKSKQDELNLIYELIGRVR